jgi:hypothetical protein
MDTACDLLASPAIPANRLASPAIPADLLASPAIPAHRLASPAIPAAGGLPGALSAAMADRAHARRVL